jgi:effector-binding domain-containing protein
MMSSTAVMPGKIAPFPEYVQVHLLTGGKSVSEPEIVVLEETTTAVIRAVVPMAELPNFFDRSFTTLFGVVAAQGVAPAGAAFGLYRGEPADPVDLEVGFATDRPVRPDGEVEPGSLPAGRVARLIHVGGFDGLGSSWQQLRSWIVEQGLIPGGVLWEVYLVEPSPDMDPADLRTELNWPVVDGNAAP